MSEIFKMIENRIEKLQEEVSPTIDEIQFFEEYYNIIHFLDKNSNSDLDTVSPDILFILCSRAYNSDIEFLELKKKVDDNKELLNKIFDNSKCVLTPRWSENLDETIKFEYELADDLLKNSIFDNENDINIIKKVLDLLYVYCNYQSMDTFEDIVKNLFNICITKNKELNFMTKQFKNQFVKNLGTDEIKFKVHKRYEEIVKMHNKFTVNLKNTYKSYILLGKTLQNINKLPYRLEPSIFKNIDDELVYEVYKFISKLNQDYCKEILKEKLPLLENSIKSQKLILKKSGFEIDRIHLTKLNFLLHYGNIDELEKMIPFLNNLNYQLIDIYSNNGLYLLVNTNYDTLLKINELLNKNIININFVKQYPQIFFNKDVVHNIKGLNNVLNTNFDILNTNYKIENQNINELLIMDNQKLYNNVNTLKKYHTNLDKNILQNEKLFDYLDLFIELGLFNDIINNSYQIDDNSINIIKRFYISKMIKFKHPNLENMIATGNNFYIANQELDDYIINNVDDYLESDIKKVLNNNNRNIIDDDNLSKLDNYLKDNLTYDFDGILISKNKVLRNLYCLKNNLEENSNKLLFCAIIYGSILDKEQIEKIKNIVYQKTYTKKIDN